MKYELSDEQVKTLQIILANANIKGSDAPAIINLNIALTKPIAEEKPKEVK